jgi:hypothetical protein
MGRTPRRPGAGHALRRFAHAEPAFSLLLAFVARADVFGSETGQSDAAAPGQDRSRNGRDSHGAGPRGWLHGIRRSIDVNMFSYYKVRSGV